MPTRLLYVDQVEERCKDFFAVVCAHDLEGMEAKPASGRYHADGRSTNWCKVKNPGYTQMTARHELFERRAIGRTRAAVLRLSA